MFRDSSPAVTHELALLGSAKGVTRLTVGFSDLLYVFNANFQRNCFVKIIHLLA
jgi:hypothetical protein